MYTLKSQDITKEPKPPFTPYTSRTVPYTEAAGGVLQNRAFGASLRLKEEDGGLSLDLTVENDAVSACLLSAGSRHEVVKLHNKIGGTLK